MGQRVVYGFLAVAVFAAVSMLDAFLARVLIDPEFIRASNPLADAIRLGLDRIDGSSIANLLSRGSFIPLTFLVVVLMGGAEMNRLLVSRSARPFTAFAYVMIGITFVSPWLSAGGWLGHRATHIEGMHGYVVLLMITFVGSGILAVLRRQSTGLFRDIGATWIMVVYLGFLPSFAMQLRCGVNVPGWHGAWLFLTVLLIIKASDISAYLVGSLIGRHKLMPTLSPGKSVEGMVGGLLGSVVVAMGLTLVGQIGMAWSGPLNVWQHLIFDVTNLLAREGNVGSTPPLLRAALLGFSLSIVAQIGDFLESGLKRDVGIKDSGNVMPSFGGILDLIDSPVLAMPVAWFLLTVVWGVV
jgi:phosphatidate cytidylyltransferase